VVELIQNKSIKHQLASASATTGDNKDVMTVLLINHFHIRSLEKFNLLA